MSTDSLPPGFDPEFYLLLNPDVANAGANASEHYLQYGRKEGRAYSRTSPPETRVKYSELREAAAFIEASGTESAFAMLPIFNAELSAREVFKSALVLGSGPTAPDVAPIVPEETIVVALNNAWCAVPRVDYAVYADDFPDANKPPPSELSRKGVSAPQYVTAMRAYGGELFCGSSMAYHAGYWLIRALPYSQISYFASDLVYGGVQDHFYGAGKPDPLRRDISLQSHAAKSLRLFYFGLTNACLILNASPAPTTRLAFPRVPSGASLKRNVMRDCLDLLVEELAEMRKLADQALALEQAAPFPRGAVDLGTLNRDAVAWEHVAKVDAKWLELEPSVRRIEASVQRILH